MTGDGASVVHGIDVGTSTSMIMIGRPGRPELLVRDPAAAQGQIGVPTSVCARQDGSLAVGYEAERIKRLRIRDYRTGFKLELGQPIDHKLGASRYSPEQLMTTVVSFLRTRALAEVATEPEVVVVTVPASWEGRNRELALRACSAAGYDAARVHLRTEPIAALAGLDPAPGTVLVYDLGGGTFDCALAVDTGRGPEILGGAYGLPHVGGRAFDDRVLRYLRETFPQVDEIFSASDETGALLRRLQLREKCVQAKIDLSVIDVHEELLVELDPPEPLEIGRATFEGLVEDLVDATVDECGRMLRELGTPWSEVDRCVLVGGSSRVPLVRRRLAETSGRPVALRPEPELAVVRGAVVLAQRIAVPQQEEASGGPPDVPAPAPVPAQEVIPPADDVAARDGAAADGAALPRPRRALRPFDPARNLFHET